MFFYQTHSYALFLSTISNEKVTSLAFTVLGEMTDKAIYKTEEKYLIQKMAFHDNKQRLIFFL